MKRLRLFADDEYEKVEVEGTTFWPRKILPGAGRDMRRRATKDGQIDEDLLESLEWEYIFGGVRDEATPRWKNLIAADGNEVPDMQEFVPLVVNHLPFTVRRRIQAAAMTAVYAAADETGN